MEEIAAYFREARKKYAKFEGSLKGVDSRILVAQVPGGMLTNMENQLREQGAADKLDQVLEEIPRVREDLGYIPLVTPTSQIVGSQAVFNVLMGERYKTITKETAALLKGEYGATPAPVNRELQLRVLEGSELITCRPADLIEPEMEHLTAELTEIATQKSLDLAERLEEDVLIYALFPQIGLRYIENRGDPDAFESPPGAETTAEQVLTEPGASASSANTSMEHYSVTVNGSTYQVTVGPAGAITDVQPVSAASAVSAPASGTTGEPVTAPLTGNIFQIKVKAGQKVNAGDVVIIMEAMKMETEVRAVKAGTVREIAIKEGDQVQSGDTLFQLA